MKGTGNDISCFLHFRRSLQSQANDGDAGGSKLSYGILAGVNSFRHGQGLVIPAMKGLRQSRTGKDKGGMDPDRMGAKRDCFLDAESESIRAVRNVRGRCGSSVPSRILR